LGAGIEARSHDGGERRPAKFFSRKIFAGDPHQALQYSLSLERKLFFGQNRIMDEKKTVYLLFVVVLIVGSFYFGRYWQKRNQWTGFYYPDVNKIDDQRTWVLSPTLNSLKECQDWVNSVHKASDINYDYSCSQGCRYTTEYIGETVICKNKTQ
jgi:hypothetical protein